MSAGKGPQPRKVSGDAFRESYDRIFGKKEETGESMEPLTDDEFDKAGLHESLRGFAYWDGGVLTTIHCHAKALEQLRPTKCIDCGAPSERPICKECADDSLSRYHKY